MKNSKKEPGLQEPKTPLLIFESHLPEEYEKYQITQEQWDRALAAREKELDEKALTCPVVFPVETLTSGEAGDESDNPVANRALPEPAVQRAIADRVPQASARRMYGVARDNREGPPVVQPYDVDGHRGSRSSLENALLGDTPLKIRVRLGADTTVECYKGSGFRKAESTGTITIGFLTPWRIGPAGISHRQLLPP